MNSLDWSIFVQEPINRIKDISRRAIGLECWLVAVVAYLLLAVGGVGLGQDITFTSMSLVPIWFLAGFVILLAIHGGYIYLSKTFVLLYLFVSVYVVLQALQSESIYLALGKIDGFLIAGCAVMVIWRYGLTKYGHRFLDRMIVVTGFILSCTVAYRFVVGGDRFFLNGPNVFGWMMSLGAIISLYRYHLSGRKAHILFFTIFLLSIVWTGSKGAFIGLIVGVSAYLLLNGYIFKLLFGALFVFGVFVLLFINDFIPEGYLAVYRLILGTIGEAEFGSIGIRQLMYIDGVRIFKENTLLGAGIANWDAYSTITRQYGAVGYPHNIVIEILAEHGLAGFILFGGICVAIFGSISILGRTIMVMFLTVLMFSGDMAYWRFAISLPIAFMSTKPLETEALKKFVKNQLGVGRFPKVHRGNGENF